MVDQNTATKLTVLLNSGQGIYDALEASGIEEHEAFSGDEYLGLEDTDRIELPQRKGIGFELNRVYSEQTDTKVWELSKYEVIRIDDGVQGLALSTD